MKRSRQRLLKLFRKIRRAIRSELVYRARRSPVTSGTILYEAFGGSGALCNPEAIFRELLRSPDVRVNRHTWALDKAGWKSGIRKEFARNPLVRFVRRDSLRYHRALATCAYLINNATFPAEFSKRAGQIYLNTWHGTPLKQMGYDMPDGASEAANTLRNFLSADYLLSQNSFMTHTMYERAYRLRGAYRGSVIEAGYPRVDHQFDPATIEATRRRLGASAGEIGDRRVVLYAPTWKGEAFARPEDNIDELLLTTQHLQAALGERFLVLLKTHQSAYAYAASRTGLQGVVVPNEIPTNAILSVTDVLVTDYSSIFFDFLATGRPIVFFTPDADDYSESRGTYIPTADLPGPSCVSEDDLARQVRMLDDGDPSWRDRLRDWRARYTPLDDGGASKRVIDIVFRGEPDESRVSSLLESPRIPLLIYLGGMRSNGITSSALNLLAHLDHETYDVSAVFARPAGLQRWHNQSLVDPRVRQFHRTGGMNGSKLGHLVRRIVDWRADGVTHRAVPSQAEMWDEEWVRCFGDTRFERVVDFSGYSPFWATLMLHSPPAIRSIWMHNDMEAETGRIIRGKPRMSRTLRAVFSLYNQFDSLVSVSESLRDVNSASLSARYDIPAEEFTFASNVVNERRVIDGSHLGVQDLVDFPLDPDTELRPVPDWARELGGPHTTRWFCTVGRFSTEKNQARLLRAFATVFADFPDARLVLVGYGPLRDELEKLIDDLGLRQVVVITGPHSNPFPIVAASDFFVLSSNYEGQPMVLLEAAIIGLPMVSVRFASVDSALPNGDILIVDQTDEALAAGMVEALRGGVAAPRFDPEAYNRGVLQEFDRATAGTRTRVA